MSHLRFSSRAHACAASLLLVVAAAAQSGPSARPAASQAAPRLPVCFVQGQDPSGPRHVGQGPGYLIECHADSVQLVRARKGQTAKVGLRFENAEVVEPAAEEPLPGRLNVFAGKPSEWRSNIPLYGAVRYRQLWPGVDLVVHDSGGDLEYDLLLAPGADLARVVLRAQGVEKAELDAQGTLRLTTALGELRQPPQ